MLHLPTFRPLSSLTAYYLSDPIPIIITLTTVSFIAFVIFDVFNDLPKLRIDFKGVNKFGNQQKKISNRSKNNLIHASTFNKSCDKPKNHSNYNLTKKNIKNHRNYNK